MKRTLAPLLRPRKIWRKIVRANPRVPAGVRAPGCPLRAPFGDDRVSSTETFRDRDVADALEQVIKIGAASLVGLLAGDNPSSGRGSCSACRQLCWLKLLACRFLRPPSARRIRNVKAPANLGQSVAADAKALS